MCKYVKTKTPWPDDTPNEIVWQQAQKAYGVLTKNSDKQKNIDRICGQTGSGKTSQVFEAIEQVNKIKKQNPVVLAVRLFAKYHPKYEEYLNNFGQGAVREKTNGFSLKCLCAVLIMAMNKGYKIVLDLTFLSPRFEAFFLKMCKANDYRVTYNVLAVSTELSHKFLKKRQGETGRIVLESSIEYFDNILLDGYEYICQNDNKNLCYIWTAYDKNFVYYGPVCQSWKTFIEHKNRLEPLKYSEEELRKQKIAIYINGNNCFA